MTRIWQAFPLGMSVEILQFSIIAVTSLNLSFFLFGKKKLTSKIFWIFFRHHFDFFFRRPKWGSHNCALIIPMKMKTHYASVAFSITFFWFSFRNLNIRRRVISNLLNKLTNLITRQAYLKVEVQAHVIMVSWLLNCKLHLKL